MPQFVRFMGDNGLPAWGEVERSDAAGRASGGLLAELPPEHDPSYYPSLMRALEEGGGGDPFQAEPGMILPPVSRPPVILAIGMNYQDHLDEVNAKNEADGKPTMPQPTEPTVFVKFPASVVGHEDADRAAAYGAELRRLRGGTGGRHRAQGCERFARQRARQRRVLHLRA